MGRTGFTLFVSLASIVVLGAPASAESPTSAPADIQKQLAQVLVYVPADTHLAVVVPDQQALGAGLSAAAAAAGLPVLQDEAAATPMLRRALGRNIEALQAHGPLVLAISAAHPDPLVLGLLGDMPPGGKEVPLALPGGARLTELGDAGFLATTSDGVAIVARDKAELQRALESNGRYLQRFASFEGVWKGAPQLVLHVDLPAWRGQVQQQLDVVAQGMYLGMAAAGPDGEMAMAMWKWIFGEIHQLLAEADQYVVAVRLDGAGLYLHDRLQVGPDGNLARYLGAVKRSEKPLLRGLPGGEWLMAFGTEWALPPEIEPLEARLLRVMFSPEMLGDKVDRTTAETALEVSLDALRHTSGYSAVIATPDPNGPPAYAGVYFSAHGNMFCQRMRKVYELNPELFQARLSLAASVKHAEEPLGKGTADVYSYVFSTTDAQLAPFLEAMYGTNPVMVMAPHAEGSFFVMGEGGVARRVAGQLAEGQGAALIDDPRVQTLLGRLTPHPQMCIVVDVPRMMNWAGRITAPLGVRLPHVETAAEAPLAGYALYLDQRAIRSELYVPVEPVRRIIEVFRQSPPERTDTQPASAPAQAPGAAAQ